MLKVVFQRELDAPQLVGRIDGRGVGAPRLTEVRRVREVERIEPELKLVFFPPHDEAFRQDDSRLQYVTGELGIVSSSLGTNRGKDPFAK